MSSKSTFYSAGKKGASILIPDGENLLLMSVVNCLSVSKRYAIFVISTTRNNAMRHSRLISGYYHCPMEDNHNAWLAQIDQVVHAHGIDLILPISEIGIHTLLTHRAQLRNSKKLAILPALDAFEIAADKGRLSDFLLAKRVPCPKGEVIRSTNDLKKLKELQFPLISKPVKGFGGGEHIKIFKEQAALVAHFSKNPFVRAHIVQEYIKGYDIDCSVLCENGVILAYTIQKGIVWEATDFAPACGVRFVHEPKLLAVVEKLMKLLKWSGIAHIDLRFDEKDQQFKVIEINPRFWLSVEASLAAGVNFPSLYVLRNLAEKIPQPEYKHTSYLNFRGLKIRAGEDRRILVKKGFLLNSTPVRYALKDPIPVLAKFLSARLKIFK